MPPSIADTPPPSPVRVLLGYLGPHRRALLGLALITVVTSTLPLALPRLLADFVDQAVAEAPVTTLGRIAGLYVAVAVTGQVVSVAASYVATRLAWRTTNTIRSELTRHTVDLDMGFHQRHSPGAMIVRIDGDVTKVADFFAVFVLVVLGSLLTLTGILFIVAFEDWRVGVVMALFAATAFTTLVRLRGAAVPASTAHRKAWSTLYGDLEERLDGLDDLRANAGGHHALRRYLEVAREVLNTGQQAVRSGTRIHLTSNTVLSLGSAAAIGVSAWLHARGTLTLGAVFMMFHYSEQIREPLWRLTDQLRQFQEAQAGANRIAGLFALRSSLPDVGTQSLPGGPLEVTIDGVTFAYDDAPVLHGVTLTVPAGTTLGLAGRTGSGKTTLGKLVARINDPTVGAVRVGGIDLRDVPLASLRHRVALVTQEVQLFRVSVRDNVALFRTDVTDEQIRDALAEVGLAAWLDGLEAGLDTELQTGSDQLSGGEAQLLALARVFVIDPSVIVLDEASSRLDPQAERRLNTAVARLLEGRTGIIIAHRLATLLRSDAVAVVADGRVVEQGAPADLACDPSSRFSSYLQHTPEVVS